MTNKYHVQETPEKHNIDVNDGSEALTKVKKLNSITVQRKKATAAQESILFVFWPKLQEGFDKRVGSIAASYHWITVLACFLYVNSTPWQTHLATKMH